jgi:hypothetical protein
MAVDRECSQCGKVKLIEGIVPGSVCEDCIRGSESEQAKYWLVHRPSNRCPEVMHQTVQKAEFEAARLAGQHVGEVFTVLEVVSAFRCPLPESPPVAALRVVGKSSSS